MYHIVFEFLVNYYDFDEMHRKGLTPLGRIIRKYLTSDYIPYFFSLIDFYILFFNLIISIILFYIVNKWYGKEDVVKTFIRLFVTFLIINIIIIAYTFIDNRFAIFFLYILYFLIPMSIMTILILPLFWLTNKIVK